MSVDVSPVSYSDSGGGIGKAIVFIQIVHISQTMAYSLHNKYYPDNVSNPRDDRAERNRGSAQHGHPLDWKRPSTTELHIGFFFLHNATEKLPFAVEKNWNPFM